MEAHEQERGRFLPRTSADGVLPGHRDLSPVRPRHNHRSSATVQPPSPLLAALSAVLAPGTLPVSFAGQSKTTDRHGNVSFSVHLHRATYHVKASYRGARSTTLGINVR
jgi:hypothetical protein